MTADRQSLWTELTGQSVVLDLSSPFVCLGRLEGERDGYLVLADADVHDLRDTPTTREKYIAETRMYGIRVNRKQVWVSLREVVGLSRLSDVNVD